MLVEKAKIFCITSTLLLTGTTWDKSRVEISQNFVAFSKYMNFTEDIVPFLDSVPEIAPHPTS